MMCHLTYVAQKVDDSKLKSPPLYVSVTKRV